MTIEWTENVDTFFFLFLITLLLFTKGIYYFLRCSSYQLAIVKVFILLVVILIFTNGIFKSIQYSEKILLPDDGNEFTAISAVRCFAEKGFTSNFGLPDFNCYNTTDMQRTEIAYDPLKVKIPYIYTHQPPAPYWLPGLFFKLCGGDDYGCLRILSTITSSFALSFFAIMLFYTLGPLKSAVALFFVAIIPMTWNMVYTFHYHNYTFSLFLIQLGFLLYFFKKKIKLSNSNLATLAILGFIQGWFSFEYFLLISLSPLSFALLYSQIDNKEDRKRFILVTFFLVVGCCFAFLLHFIQNSLYFGSVTGAFRDLFERGRTRLLSQPIRWEIDRISMLLNYFFLYPRSFNFFIINFPVFLGVTLILMWFQHITITIQNPIQVKLQWISSRRNYFVILTALLASFLWIFIMYNHASSEIAHLPRIIFFSYFVCILTILECISLNNS